MKTRLDINSVAVKQLESAIWMYAYDYDEVAVHTIAGAAFEIYSKRLGLSDFTKNINKYIKPEKRKDFLALMNKPYNFFKHGEHRYEKLDFIEYDEESVELLIYLTVEANMVGHEKFRLSCANAYRVFYMVNHPELFDSSLYGNAFSKTLNQMGFERDLLKDKEVLRMLLKNIGNTFLNGSDSPFRNIRSN